MQKNKHKHIFTMKNKYLYKNTDAHTYRIIQYINITLSKKILTPTYTHKLTLSYHHSYTFKQSYLDMKHTYTFSRTHTQKYKNNITENSIYKHNLKHIYTQTQTHTQTYT